MNKQQIINAAKLIGFWKENDGELKQLVLNGEDEILRFAEWVHNSTIEEAAISVEANDECGEYGDILVMCAEHIRQMKASAS